VHASPEALQVTVLQSTPDLRGIQDYLPPDLRALFTAHLEPLPNPYAIRCSRQSGNRSVLVCCRQSSKLGNRPGRPPWAWDCTRHWLLQECHCRPRKLQRIPKCTALC